MIDVGRPPLPVGTAGKTLFLTLPSGQIQARTIFRDYDGAKRLVSKNARTKAAAERALKIALAQRQTPAASGALSSSTRVAELAAVWLETEHDWSSGTERTYRSVVRNQVVPALGALRLSEVTAGGISRALRSVRERHGAGAAKSAKACLSGMFAMAIEDSAMTSNPVRDATVRIGSANKTPPRALTSGEADELAAWLHDDDRAKTLDLPDLVDWMLATGCRIGEALALRYAVNRDGKPLLDLDANTWEVDATVVRVPRRGLIVQPRPKTAAGWRVVAVPAFAVEMMRTRSVNDDGMVFRSPGAGTLRDPSNASGDLRQVLDAHDCRVCNETGFRVDADGNHIRGAKGQRVRCDQGPWSWVTSHVFRKTVATRLDEAGFTARQVADQLGHANPSMTLDVYFGRQVVSSSAADVLDRRSSPG